MTIETQIRLNNGEIEVRNIKTVIAQMEEMGCEVFDVVINRPFEFKTSDQLAYAFAEVFVKAMLGYRRMGVKVKDKYMAFQLLCLEEDVDFTTKIIDENTGDVLARVPKRLSTAPKYEVYELISDAIMFIETNLQTEVNLPEEYRKYGKVKKNMA